MKRNKKQLDEFDTNKIKRAAVGGAIAGASVLGLTHSGNKYISNPNNGKENTEQASSVSDDYDVSNQEKIANMAEFMKNHPELKEGKRLKVTLTESQLHRIVKEATKKVLKEWSWDGFRQSNSKIDYLTNSDARKAADNAAVSRRNRRQLQNLREKDPKAYQQALKDKNFGLKMRAKYKVPINPYE